MGLTLSSRSCPRLPPAWRALFCLPLLSPGSGSPSCHLRPNRAARPTSRFVQPTVDSHQEGSSRSYPADWQHWTQVPKSDPSAQVRPSAQLQPLTYDPTPHLRSDPSPQVRPLLSAQIRPLLSAQVGPLSADQAPRSQEALASVGPLRGQTLLCDRPGGHGDVCFPKCQEVDEKEQMG